LQPCLPTFISARNAIIQADTVNNRGINKCLLWKGFAKRGLGVLARPIVEDFSVPNECKGINLEQ